MQLGLGRLRLPADRFWAMTPREITAAARALSGPPASPPPLARRDLNMLMEQFPDTEEPNPSDA